MPAEPRFTPLAAAEPLPRKRRWLRRLAIAFVLFLVAVVTGYGVWRYQASTARDAEIAKIQAAGEPVWFADLKPQPLDPAVDGTPLLQQAFDAIVPLPSELEEEMQELHEPIKDQPEFDAVEDLAPDDVDAGEVEAADGELNKRADNETPVDPLPPEEMLLDANRPEGPLDDLDVQPAKPITFASREKRLVEKLRPHVEENRPVYELLDKALEKGQFQFDIDYDSPIPFLIEQPTFDSLFALTSLIEARWRCQIHDGDSQAATASTVQLLRYAKARNTNPRSQIDFLVMAFVNNLGVEMLAETTARTGIAPVAAAQINGLLTDLDATFRLRPALEGERAGTLTVIENMLEHGKEGEPIVRSKMLQGVFRPYIWMNQAWYLEYLAPRVEYADRFDDEAVQAIKDLEARQEADDANMFTKPLWMGQMLLPVFDWNEKALLARNQFRSARLGLHIDAYRRVHGRLPGSLDEIKSKVLPDIPRDVADKGPLAYLVDKDAFTICSVADVEIERQRLADRVKERDATPDPKPAEKDPLENFFPVRGEDPPAYEVRQSGAFQVVYPAATQSDPKQPAAATSLTTPEIIAHRGASHDAPENTLSAIKLAWEQKADAVEFDVWLSKDGQIVLMHDATTKRTAGVDKKVVDQTYAELQKLDVGSWKDKRFAGEKIATLAEALAAIPDTKRAFIEVKCGPEIVPDLKRVISAAKLKPTELKPEQMAVISFNAEVIAATKAALPDTQAYWLVDPKPNKEPVWTADTILAKAQQIKSDGLNLSAQPLVTPEFIARMKTAKLPVYVWTIDDPEIATRMTTAGATGITTNRPQWLRDQLNK